MNHYLVEFSYYIDSVFNYDEHHMTRLVIADNIDEARTKAGDWFKKEYGHMILSGLEVSEPII